MSKELKRTGEVVVNMTVDEDALKRTAVKIIKENDLVKVVRCKDCKFNGAKNEDEGDCAMMEYKHNGDDYCSYGERKDDECE